MSFVFFPDTGYSSLVMDNKPIPSFRTFQAISRLLSENKIVNFNFNQDYKDSFGNIVMVFLDNKGNQWHSVVQYNNNVMNPPISFQPYIVLPSVICLKGNIHTYGSSLEKAPMNLVYIGRNLSMGGWKISKSKWHNPFTVKQYGRDDALKKYREYILNTPELLDSLPELGDKILACWCKSDEPCHGNILIELYQQYI
jgi:hypothetical protein